ncbi:MAG: Trk system potassium transporter TrkA [Nitrospirae bacterium]|jgi:trk system potassium uptake protein TrkA|nr:Trk system potassium transporter TrkA [Nitrospirota bacterium]
MRVIIIGAGEVGYQIARFLSYEQIDCVVIDKDRNKIKRISEEIDVAVIEGEGGSSASLREAEADKADILLAVTDKDETNMIACLLAKAMFKIPRKIARIRNPEYFFNESLLKNLDIDPAINPELEIAKAISRILEAPFATDIEDFEGGIIKVIGFKIPENSPIIGKSLKSFNAEINKKFLIGLILRDEKTIIPTGDDVVKNGDIIYIPVRAGEIQDIISILGIVRTPAKRIMILGGGKVGFNVASYMESKADIKIVEKNLDRCKYLSKNLKRSLILNADGTEQKVLIEENIGDMDAFVAVSNNDELNIMVSLLAKKLGAKKNIALVNKTEYIFLAHSLGLQAVLSPRLLTASTILRYVRKGDILSLTSIAEGRAEILEGRIGRTSPLINKTLDKAQTKASIIGAIIRGNDVIIPSGSDRFFENDKLIIFTLRESIKSVEKILM